MHQAKQLEDVKQQAVLQVGPILAQAQVLQPVEVPLVRDEQQLLARPLTEQLLARALV